MAAGVCLRDKFREQGATLSDDSGGASFLNLSPGELQTVVHFSLFRHDDLLLLDLADASFLRLVCLF